MRQCPLVPRTLAGMTVAAVILSATADGAVADTLGQPRVRRLADLAWSGGALPIVVAGTRPGWPSSPPHWSGPRRSTAPLPRPKPGPSGQMVRGTELAMDEVSDTSAVLLWPARMTWVGPGDDHVAHRGPWDGPRIDAAAGVAR